MAELLTMLTQLQTRFAPFLERYQNFMQEDPEVSSEVSYLFILFNAFVRLTWVKYKIMCCILFNFLVVIYCFQNERQTQIMLNRVSEVLHFMGHAYHSLSDIIIRVRTPPPRPLLCRPILIQHSAVVQTGIPIQVEVNIAFIS